MEFQIQLQISPRNPFVSAFIVFICLVELYDSALPMARGNISRNNCMISSIECDISLAGVDLTSRAGTSVKPTLPWRYHGKSRYRVIKYHENYKFEVEEKRKENVG